MSNVVNFPKIQQHASVGDALEAARGWGFEDVVIVGRLPDEADGITLFINVSKNPSAYLEMSEAARTAYLFSKGYLK